MMCLPFVQCHKCTFQIKDIAIEKFCNANWKLFEFIAEQKQAEFKLQSLKLMLHFKRKSEAMSISSIRTLSAWEPFIGQFY